MKKHTLELVVVSPDDGWDVAEWVLNILWPHCNLDEDAWVVTVDTEEDYELPEL